MRVLFALDALQRSCCTDGMCLQSRARSMESHEQLTQSRAENKEQRTSSSTKFNNVSSFSTTGVEESVGISCSHGAGVV